LCNVINTNNLITTWSSDCFLYDFFLRNRFFLILLHSPNFRVEIFYITSFILHFLNVTPCGTLPVWFEWKNVGGVSFHYIRLQAQILLGSVKNFNTLSYHQYKHTVISFFFFVSSLSYICIFLVSVLSYYHVVKFNDNMQKLKNSLWTT
jgi:hypothetical protein